MCALRELLTAVDSHMIFEISGTKEEYKKNQEELDYSFEAGAMLPSLSSSLK